MRNYEATIYAVEHIENGRRVRQHFTLLACAKSYFGRLDESDQPNLIPIPLHEACEMLDKLNG